MKLNKNYWEERYQNNEIGWDTGTITTPLQEYIDQIENKNLYTIIGICMMGFLGLGGLSFTLGGSIKGKIFFYFYLN